MAALLSRLGCALGPLHVHVCGDGVYGLYSHGLTTVVKQSLGCLVFKVEGQELVKDVAAFANAGMAKDLPASNHVEGDACKADGNFDVTEAWVLASGPPGGGQQLEAVIAAHQGVG